MRLSSEYLMEILINTLQNTYYYFILKHFPFVLYCRGDLLVIVSLWLN